MWGEDLEGKKGKEKKEKGISERDFRRCGRVVTVLGFDPVAVASKDCTFTGSSGVPHDPATTPLFLNDPGTRQLFLLQSPMHHIF